MHRLYNRALTNCVTEKSQHPGSFLDAFFYLLNMVQSCFKVRLSRSVIDYTNYWMSQVKGNSSLSNWSIIKDNGQPSIFCTSYSRNSLDVCVRISDRVGVIYANRSAVLYELRKYKDCLQDIKVSKFGVDTIVHIFFMLLISIHLDLRKSRSI